jgi:uncharacterized protein involved in type VI secretion and phage assembly
MGGAGVHAHGLGPLHELHLGTVLDNADPERRGRIRVRLHATALEAWAAVAVQSAGRGYGVSCLPRAGEQVVLAFASPDLPIVLGAVWSGEGARPDAAAPVEDRYLVQTPRGLRVLLDDAGPTVRVETPAGHHLTLSDEGAGSVTVERGAERIELAPGGVTISTSATVTVRAAEVKLSAGMVTVEAALSRFTGVVQCDTLISSGVVSASYTPGAGNLW